MCTRSSLLKVPILKRIIVQLPPSEGPISSMRASPFPGRLIAAF